MINIEELCKPRPLTDYSEGLSVEDIISLIVLPECAKFKFYETISIVVKKQFPARISLNGSSLTFDVASGWFVLPMFILEEFLSKDVVFCSLFLDEAGNSYTPYKETFQESDIKNEPSLSVQVKKEELYYKKYFLHSPYLPIENDKTNKENGGRPHEPTTISIILSFIQILEENSDLKKLSDIMATAYDGENLKSSGFRGADLMDRLCVLTQKQLCINKGAAINKAREIYSFSESIFHQRLKELKK